MTPWTSCTRSSWICDPPATPGAPRKQRRQAQPRQSRYSGRLLPGPSALPVYRPGVTIVGEAFVAVRPDVTGFGQAAERDLERAARSVGDSVGSVLGGALADSSSQRFSRDLNGKLRDERGKFVKAGEEIGEDLGTGIARTADDKLTSGLKSTVLKIGAIVGAGFLFHALGSAIREVSDEYAASAKVGRLTEAVITSTGGAANITAKEIGALSEALAAKTGIDDEIIQNGANVLATFTSVRNEVGAGNDIFNQGILAASNMSAALGEDLQGSVIRLGKALNDPVGGVTALRKVGVQLTDQQRDQIEAFVASNDILSAQKVILGELATEFGGAAVAAADPISRLRVIISNAKETIGQGLSPVINSVADALSTALPPLAATVGLALSSVVNDFLGPLVTQIGPLLDTVVKALVPVLREAGAALGPIIGAVAAAFQALAPAIGPIAAAIGSVLTAVGQVLGALAPLLAPFAQIIGVIAQAVGTVLTDALLGLVTVITPIVNTLVPIFTSVFQQLAPVIQDLAVQVGGLLKSALETLAPIFVQLAPVISEVVSAFLKLNAGTISTIFRVVITVVEALLKALTPLLPVIIKVAELFANILAEAMRELAPVITRIVEALGGAFVRIIEQLAPMLPQLADAFLQIVDAALQLVVALLPILPPLIEIAIQLFEKIGIPNLLAMVTAFSLMARALTPIAVALADILSAGLQIVADILATLVGIAADLFNKIPSIAAFFTGIGDSIRNGVVTAIDDVLRFFTELPDNIFNAIGDLGTKLFNFAVGSMEELIRGFGQAAGDVVTFFASLPGTILRALGDLGGELARGILNGFRDVWNTIADTINDALPDDVDLGLFSIDFPDNPVPRIHRFALGGIGSGLGIVGEDGPELMQFGAASSVFPKGQLAAALRELLPAGVGAGATMVDRSVQLHGDVIVPVTHNAEDAAFAFADELSALMFRNGAG